MSCTWCWGTCLPRRIATRSSSSSNRPSWYDPPSFPPAQSHACAPVNVRVLYFVQAYQLRLADLYYSMGDVENLLRARKHYTIALNMQVPSPLSLPWPHTHTHTHTRILPCCALFVWSPRRIVWSLSRADRETQPAGVIWLARDGKTSGGGRGGGSQQRGVSDQVRASRTLASIVLFRLTVLVVTLP